MEGQSKVHPRKYDLEAVLTISSFNECPELGIKSVIRLSEYFSVLHIVQYGYSTSKHLYREWPTDLKALRECGLEPKWHNRFDASKMKALAIVHIQPDVEILEGAMEVLLQNLIANAYHYDHFAITTVTDLDTDEQRWYDVPLYGFLFVILWLDTLRYLYNFGKYHRTVDLRAQTATLSFPHYIALSGNRWWAWLFFTRISSPKDGSQALTQIPSEAGFPLVLRIIKTHDHLGFGVFWMLTFIVFLYPFYAYPFWPQLDIHAGSSIPSIILSIFINHKIHGTTWITCYIINCLFLGYVGWHHIHIQFYYFVPLVLLFPFYLAASPVLYFCGRFA